MKTLEEIDAELIQVQNKINEYYAIQQRLLGYKQVLIDQENGTGESTVSQSRSRVKTPFSSSTKLEGSTSF